jgi:hypothetical protein
MQKGAHYVNMLIGMVLVFALAGGLYLFVAKLIGILSSVQSDLTKTLVAAAVTALIAVFTLVYGKAWEQRQNIRQALREKKVPVYEEMIRIFFHVLMGDKAGKEPMTEQQLTAAFVALTEKLVIWGSSDVLKAWGAFRTNSSKDDAGKGLLLMEAIFRAVRTDLGHNTNALSSREMLQLWINDLDDAKLTSSKTAIGGDEGK